MHGGITKYGLGSRLIQAVRSAGAMARNRPPGLQTFRTSVGYTQAVRLQQCGTTNASMMSELPPIIWLRYLLMLLGYHYFGNQLCFPALWTKILRTVYIQCVVLMSKFCKKIMKIVIGILIKEIAGTN